MLLWLFYNICTLGTVSNNEQRSGIIYRTFSVGPEDLIRELCTQLLAAQNDEAISSLIPLLRAALHELKSATEYASRKDVAAD